MLRRLQTRGLGGLRAGQGRPLALVMTCLLALLLLVPGDGAAPALRLWCFDRYQVLLPRARESGPVQVIAIDEAALKEYGQWPWPRTQFAELVKHTAAYRPRAIGLDILMPEADPTSPEALAQRLPPGSLRDELSALPPNDEVLAAAMRRTPIVLGAAGFKYATATTSDSLRVWPVKVEPHGAALPVPAFPQALASLPLMQGAAKGQGFLSVELEHGLVRRVPLVSALRDTLVPSLSIELLRVAVGARSIAVAADEHGVRTVSVGDLHVPAMPDGRVWVNFSRPAAERYLSAVDLMQDRLDPAALQDKIVIIAQTGLGLMDSKTNARGDIMPGVDVHAQMIESFLDGAFLQRPEWMRWAEAGAFAAACLLLIWSGPRLGLRLTVPLAGMLSLAMFGGGAWLFVRAGLLFDAASVFCAMAIVCFCLLAGMQAAAVRDRKRSERALQLEREAAAKTAGELGAAHRIQMATLPVPAQAFPGERRFVLDALLEPAREVGGDLYDFFMLDRDHVFFMVGDVSGKGLPASLFMVVAKALSKSVALRSGADMGAIMNAVNVELLREDPEMLFVTCIAGILDAASGGLVLCNAGHDAPRRLRPGAQAEHLAPADGPPLCVMEDFDYPVQRYQLQPGDCLCLSTDGVTEAMNEAGELYGNERLDRLLVGLPAAATPSAILRAVREDVRRHVAGAQPSDDLTLLVLGWNGPAT